MHRPRRPSSSVDSQSIGALDAALHTRIPATAHATLKTEDHKGHNYDAYKPYSSDSVVLVQEWGFVFGPLFVLFSAVFWVGGGGGRFSVFP